MGITGSLAAAAAIEACGTDDRGRPSSGTSSRPGPSRGGERPGETKEVGKGDLDILDYLLRVEHVEAAFYAAALKSGLLTGQALKLATKFGREESVHAAALTDTIRRLGGHPASKPRTHFTFRSPRKALELASQIENLGVAAYLGQMGNLESPRLLSFALSIHSVEGRHSAAVDALRGTSISPDGAFAKPATKAVVLKNLQPFIQ